MSQDEKRRAALLFFDTYVSTVVGRSDDACSELAKGASLPPSQIEYEGTFDGEDWGNFEGTSMDQEYDKDLIVKIKEGSEDAFYPPDGKHKGRFFTASQCDGEELSSLVTLGLEEHHESYTCQCVKPDSEMAALNHYVQVQKIAMPITFYETKGPAHSPTFQGSCAFQGQMITTRMWANKKDVDKEVSHIIMKHVVGGDDRPMVSEFVEELFHQVVKKRGDNVTWLEAVDHTCLTYDSFGRDFSLVQVGESVLAKLQLMHTYNKHHFAYELLPDLPVLVSVVERLVKKNTGGYALDNSNRDVLDSNWGRRQQILAGLRMLLSSHDRGRAFKELVASPLCGIDRRRQCDWAIGGVDLRLIVDNEVQLRYLTVLPANNYHFLTVIKELFGVAVGKRMLVHHFGTSDSIELSRTILWSPIQDKRGKDLVKIRAGKEAILRLKGLRRSDLAKEKDSTMGEFRDSPPRDSRRREETDSEDEEGNFDSRVVAGKSLSINLDVARKRILSEGVKSQFGSGKSSGELEEKKIRLVPEIDSKSHFHSRGAMNEGKNQWDRGPISQSATSRESYNKDEMLAMILHVIPEERWATNRELISDMRRNGWRGEKRPVNQLLHEMVDVLWEVKSEKGYNYWRRKSYE
jgi:hypothetical protein